MARRNNRLALADGGAPPPLATADELEAHVAGLVDRAGATPDANERVSLLLEAAHVFEERLADGERALVAIEAALDADSGTRAAAAYERLVRECSEQDLRAGRLAAALDRLSTATLRLPDAHACRSLLVVVLGLVGEAEEARAEREALMDRAPDDATRVTRLFDLAEACRAHGDANGALSALEALLAVPGCESEALHQALDAAVALGGWRLAVEALRRLAGPASGTERATLLVAAAKILDRKLDVPAVAAQLFEEALDLAPDPNTFDRLRRLYVGREDWRGLERAVRHMIKRIGSNPPHELRPVQSALWRELAEVYQARLADPRAAAVAYEVSTTLAETTLSYAEIQARMRARRAHA